MASPDRAPQRTEPFFPAVAGDLRGLEPDQVARNQNQRLKAAMVEAVARHGYEGTTLRELVRLAGVSKSTFYEHFDSKQECFLATFDEIVSQLAARASGAYSEDGDLRERLAAALTVFMNLMVNEPEAARLATVESLALGEAGVAHREQGSAAFELMIHKSLEHSSSVEVSPTTVRAIAAGFRGVVYRRLRTGGVDQLPGLVDDLVDWALEYRQPEGEAVRLAAAAAAEPASDSGAKDDSTLDWREPPGSPRSRTELTQRERIVRAIGQLVLERGYGMLSIPSISAKAGTSNQTFYEHFSNKREAFIATFDASAAEALVVTDAAFVAAGAGPEATGAAIRAILEHISRDELFARLTFFELQTAGPDALDRADATMDRFTAFLRPTIALKGAEMQAPDELLLAIGSGAWSVIQHELVAGRGESLPERAPELARIVLTPFAGR
jgi:AcrR family transcriptional regulator